MSDMYERSFIVSPDYAEETSGIRGDDVVVIQTRDNYYHMHFRRGMTAEDVAGGLESIAATIRGGAPGDHQDKHNAAISRGLEKAIMVAQGAPNRLSDYDRVSVKATSRHIIDEIKSIMEALR